MNETQLKIKVLKWLKKEYPEGFFYKASDNFTAGIPDILGCVNGQFIGIELKGPGGEATKIQLYTIDKIATAGGLVMICNSLEGVQDILRRELV